MKIEKLIEEVRSNAEKMFAALDALNESLSVKEVRRCGNCGLARVCKSPTADCICKDWIAIPEINQPKLPVIGEMAIMWDSRKSEAICAIFGDKENGLYYCNTGKPHYNAILYESPEQYKEFLKS